MFFLKNDVENRIDISEANKNLLWCPFADITASKIKTKGKYPKRYPEGAVIHFTAGRSLSGDVDAINTVAHLAKSEYPCIVISRTGRIYQPFPLDEWGSHSGTIHHKTHIGIEICCAGILDNSLTSWFGEKYTKEMCRYSDNYHNIKKGWYLRFSPAQEQALTSFLLWLKRNNPIFDINKIVGHDEIAPDRKSDPGASLSCSIPEYRKILKGLYEKI